MIRAHHPLLLVDTVEEDRVHVLLEHAAEHTGLPLFSWTQVDGLRRELPDPGHTPDSGPPQKALAFIERSNLEAIFHLRGLGPYLHEPAVIALIKRVKRRRSISSRADCARISTTDTGRSLRAAGIRRS